MALKVFFKTFGCTYNFADSDKAFALLKQSLPEGMQKADCEKNADVVVVNSCSVKDATSSKILHYASTLAKQKKPLVVCGCLAQTSPDLIRHANAKASLVGTRALSKMPQAVLAAFKGGRVEFLDFCDDEKPFEKITEKAEEREATAAVAAHQLKRAKKENNAAGGAGLFARIQICQGCLGACSFCSAKLARGHLKSKPSELVVAEAKAALNAGAKELQLTAQDAGCFGWDLNPKEDLPLLLEKVCALKGDFRVRVGMMNPQHVKKMLPRLLHAFENPKVYKFFHIPVQSGSGKVLSDMNRQHSVSDFEGCVKEIKKAFPDALIATDLIVGYPTESQADFEKTLDLVRRTRPSVANVSKYSSRPGTKSASLPLLENQVVKKRSEKLSELCKKISLENKAQGVGKKMRVLLLEKNKSKASQFVGRAPNYFSVVVEGKNLRAGEFIDVQVYAAGQSHFKATTLFLFRKKKKYVEPKVQRFVGKANDR